MITGIIMASGFSKRMGRNKLLFPIEGDYMIERVIKAAKSSNIDKLLIVYNNKDIEEIGAKHGAALIYNSNPEKGQSQSMKLGIEASDPQNQAYVFFVGDQPYLEVDTINKLIELFKNNKGDIIVPLYNGRRGNPTVFSAKLRDRLLEVEGDRGGRAIIEEMKDRVFFIDIEEDKSGIDIDTWEEYQSIKDLEMKKC